LIVGAALVAFDHRVAPDVVLGYDQSIPDAESAVLPLALKPSQARIFADQRQALSRAAIAFGKTLLAGALHRIGPQAEA
jgi:hypothetical protein